MFTSRPSAQQHISEFPICSHTLRILYKTAAVHFFPYFQASSKNLNFSFPQTQQFTSIIIFTMIIGMGTVALGCSIGVAVGKDQAMAQPRMSATDADVVGISLGDLPPCRHGQRLFAIINIGAIIVDFVTMKRHVQIGTVALTGAR
jgi:hypothetical protein